jgi:hypothetical protein
MILSYVAYRVLLYIPTLLVMRLVGELLWLGGSLLS